MEVKEVLPKIKVPMNKTKASMSANFDEHSKKGSRQFCYWLKFFIASKLDYVRVDKNLEPVILFA